MSSRSPNTQGQLAIAKLAQGINAVCIEADIDALEAGNAVSSFGPLTTAWAALRPGTRGLNSRRHLGLRQGSQRPGVDLSIEAGGLDLHKHAGIANISGNGAERAAACWDGIAVEPPRAAQGDGEAATIVVCHGRRSLPGDCFADVGSALFRFARQGLERPDNVSFGHDLAEEVNVAHVGDALGLLFGQADCDFCGEDGLHFGLLPLISRGADRKQRCFHELNYTHQTKECNNFFEIISQGRGEQAKPSNAD